MLTALKKAMKVLRLLLLKHIPKPPMLLTALKEALWLDGMNAQRPSPTPLTRLTAYCPSGSQERQARQLTRAGWHLFPALREFKRQSPAPQWKLPSYEKPPLFKFIHVDVFNSDIRVAVLKRAICPHATLSVDDTPLLHRVLQLLEENRIPLITLVPTTDSFLRLLECIKKG